MVLCMSLIGLASGRADEAAAIPPGSGEQTVTLDGLALQVFTYRPANCRVAGILLVFHGVGRDAPGYRDAARPLADQLCLLVAAPLFDAQRFPSWRYQRGGIVHDGKLQPAADWTVDVVPRLADWVRAQERRPELPYALIGHSGGGQFLSRVAAFLPVAATHIVIANPSTWVMPSLDTPVPYGFGGISDLPQAEAALRRYLAAPVTVLLGQEDTGSHELAVGAEAEAQGSTRLARGQNAFRLAAATARAHGWPFNWRLLFVPGVGHSARLMFGSKEALAALQP
jgi:poly(3-hydroxybutyrate) depolymerase